MRALISSRDLNALRLRLLRGDTIADVVLNTPARKRVGVYELADAVATGAISTVKLLDWLTAAHTVARRNTISSQRARMMRGVGADRPKTTGAA